MMSKWTDYEPWMVEGCADILLTKVSIVDIVGMWGYELTQSPCGESFSHKTRCMLPVHMKSDGEQERTASLFVSESQNRFYCFGCCSSGSVVDLVSLYYGCPYYEALKWLWEFSELKPEDVDGYVSVKRIPVDPEHKVLYHVYHCGIAIRDFVVSITDPIRYKKAVGWSERRFKELDKISLKEDTHWEAAKRYYDKVVGCIAKHQGKE